jgi:hypothetical protein
MTTNALIHADALSDQDLIASLDRLAAREREASVELVAHLAALDARRHLYLERGYSSLFAYCTEALHLSEDAACNRIEVARACRRFPVILEHVASGALSLTSARLIGRHLTAENHEAVLARACGRTRHEIEILVAELAPRPDVPTSVRKLPPPRPVTPTPSPTPSPAETASAPTPVFLSPPRPVIQATAPERFRVQFTIGPETHDTLRRLQTLLRREIPSGDPAQIVDRALTLLLETVERKKLGIRPGTDRPKRSASFESPALGGVVEREQPFRHGPLFELQDADLGGRPAP